MNNSCLTDKLTSVYETDFHAWTQQQAKFLQEGKWSCLDVPNLVEEIESLGRQERRELRNRLKILLGHLLKWEFQFIRRSGSWLSTIQEQRDQVCELLDDSPSLRPMMPEIVQKVYSKAVDLAVRETSLDRENFPTTCPYSLEEILDVSFLPGEGELSDLD